MMFQERFLGMRFETEEIDELFGEDVVRPDIEPGALTHLIDVVPRFRHVAEVAVGDEAQLIIVVEDNAPVTRDAEILQ